MLNNFIYAKSKAMFEERLHEVPNEAIVFIEDTKEIWNHGHYFAGEGVNVNDFNNLQTEVSQLSADKQDKLVDGINIATINGQSLTEGGDLTIEGGAKIYEWVCDGESESVTLSQEEYDNITEADIVVVNFGGLWSGIVNKTGKEFSEAVGRYALIGQLEMGEVKLYININIEISTKLAKITLVQQEIPTKTSQLENDSNFVTSDGLKTINGESIVGSGNITISGGGSSSGSGAYAEVNHGTSDTTFTLTPNTFHVWDEVASLTLDFGSETTGVANEYLFQFTSGATATTLSISDDIKWTEELVIESNMIYQVSILKGLASVLSWKIEASITFPITLEMGNNGENGVLLYNYFADTYGQATAGTAITEEIYNNGFGTSLLVSTIEYGEHSGYTGYWLNDYTAMRMSWVLQSDGYMIRVVPVEEI